MTLVYIIKCDRMHETDRIRVTSFPELLLMLKRYMELFGPLELLFQESQTR